MDRKPGQTMTKADAEENLVFIRKIIEEGRTILIENGSTFIFWGTLMCSGTLFSYILALFHLGWAILYLWLGIYILGFAVFFLLIRKRKTVWGKGSFASRINGITWIGSALSIPFAAGVGLALGRIDLGVCMGFVACIVGIAYFITSAIIRYRWLLILSFGWWLGSVVILFIPMFWAPAFMGGMVFLFELVPGVIVYLSKRKPVHVG
jgi:hypothetical protein